MRITKEDFFELLNGMRSFWGYVNKLEELNISIIETQLFEYPGQLQDKLLYLYFDEAGSDTIGWYMYEQNAIEGEPCSTEYMIDGEKVIIRNDSDLWDAIEKHRRTIEN